MPLFSLFYVNNWKLVLEDLFTYQRLYSQHTSATTCMGILQENDISDLYFIVLKCWYNKENVCGFYKVEFSSDIVGFCR